eukprot:3020631-Amphidinium_carterae.1
MMLIINNTVSPINDASTMATDKRHKPSLQESIAHSRNCQHSWVLCNILCKTAPAAAVVCASSRRILRKRPGNLCLHAQHTRAKAVP